MKHLIHLNDPPYGTERSFNGLRMAHALAKNDPGAEITVFLMADAVLCAKARQKTPHGYYNLERMLRRVLSAKGARPDVRHPHGRARADRGRRDRWGHALHHGRTRSGDTQRRQGAGVLMVRLTQTRLIMNVLPLIPLLAGGHDGTA